MSIEIIQPQPTNETPLTVENYPYGFRLRTKARYWIDTVNGKGQRIAFQTLNPKTQQWNKPKMSTYSDLLVLYRNTENGHIENDGLSFAYCDEKELSEFLSNFPESSLTDYQQKRLRVLRAIQQTRKFVKVSIVENPSEERSKQIEEHEKQTTESLRKIFMYNLAHPEKPLEPEPEKPEA